MPPEPAPILDANEELARDLAAALSPTSTEPLVMAGPVETLLAEQPFSEGIPSVSWDVDEPETVSHLQRLFRDAGADVALSNTRCASPAALAAANLPIPCERVAADSVRCAFSSGCRYVMGVVGPGPLEPGEDGSQERSHAELDASRLALALVRARVHGVLVDGGGSLVRARAALAGTLRVCARPVMVTVDLDDVGSLTETSEPLEEAFTALAARGPASPGPAVLGATVPSPDVAAVLAPRIASAARSLGARPLMRVGAGEPLTSGEGDVSWPFSATDFEPCGRTLAHSGITLLGTARGARPAALGYLADAVLELRAV